jgi:hypothetical protein
VLSVLQEVGSAELGEARRRAEAAVISIQRVHRGCVTRIIIAGLVLELEVEAAGRGASCRAAAAAAEDGVHEGAEAIRDPEKSVRACFIAPLARFGAAITWEVVRRILG